MILRGNVLPSYFGHASSLRYVAFITIIPQQQLQMIDVTFKSCTNSMRKKELTDDTTLFCLHLCCSFFHCRPPCLLLPQYVEVLMMTDPQWFRYLVSCYLPHRQRLKFVLWLMEVPQKGCCTRWVAPKCFRLEYTESLST